MMWDFCVANRHYMVDTSSKIAKILDLIEQGKYFTINRPRQFGKTTTMSLLFKALNQREDYLAFKISFEGVATPCLQTNRPFVRPCCAASLRPLMFTNPDLSEFFTAESKRCGI